MLKIDQNLMAEVAGHAVEEYPHECCGILLGRRQQISRTVDQVVRCVNVSEQPERSYSLDPERLIAVQRDARDLGLEIVGFYHSHPDHPPNASQRDLEEAFWDGCSYLIVEVDQGQIAAARSFELTVQGHERVLLEEPLMESVLHE